MRWQTSRQSEFAAVLCRIVGSSLVLAFHGHVLLVAQSLCSLSRRSQSSLQLQSQQDQRQGAAQAQNDRRNVQTTGRSLSPLSYLPRYLHLYTAHPEIR